jgi:hypothetical protein
LIAAHYYYIAGIAGKAVSLGGGPVAGLAVVTGSSFIPARQRYPPTPADLAEPDQIGREGTEVVVVHLHDYSGSSQLGRELSTEIAVGEEGVAHAAAS